MQLAVEVGIASKYIGKVLISTDDEKIANEATRYGAWCPFLRPKELATDQSIAIETYVYTIDRLRKEFDFNTGALCVLQPTSPLRKVEDVDSAVSLFLNTYADSVISYCLAEKPIEWHRYIDAKNSIIDVLPNNKLLNRQFASKTYLPNGAIFVFKPDILKRGIYITKNSRAYIMPKDRSVDIDDWVDFKLAEALTYSNQS